MLHRNGINFLLTFELHVFLMFRRVPRGAAKGPFEMQILRTAVASLVLAAGLAACATAPVEKTAAMATVEVERVDPVADWRGIISAADLARLERVDLAWREALAQARKAGHGKAIEAEGPLLDPDAALPRAAPPPGPYLCRVLKLGHPEGKTGLDFVAYKNFTCHVEAEAERPVLAGEHP